MKNRTMIAAVSVVALSASIAISSPSEASPSFDCNYARAPDEIAICQNPELANEDLEMSSAYFYLHRLAVEEGRRSALGALERSQREWLAARRECGSNASCLRRAYEDRLQDFASMRQAYEAPRAEQPIAPPPEAPLTMEQDRERVIQEGQAHCERWPDDKICHPRD